MIEVISDKDISKTRKPHMCFGCMETIPAGSPAHIQVNTDMGIGSVYTHIECEKIIEEMNKYYHDLQADDFERGCVIDYLREDMNFEGTPAEYLKLKEAK